MKSAVRRARSQFRPRSQGVPVPTASGFYGLPGLPGYNADDTYIRSYGSNGTIYAIVSLYAETTASNAWHLYRKNKRDGRVRYTTGDRGSDQRQEVVVHPALDLWNNPNNFMPGFVFRETFQTQFELTGKSFWVIDRGNVATLPLGMWPISPARMEPVPSNESFIAGWVYTSPAGEKVPLNNDEVVWMRRPDPNDPYGAVGPIQTILPVIDAAKYADEYNRNFFLNNAIPGGILTLDGEMTEPQFQEMADQWREQHMGVSRAHRVAVLENVQKANFVLTGTNQRDMDFVNLSQQSRDKMREAWRMHKHMMGTVDDVNRANAQTAEEIFAAWGETPRLERIKLTLNHQYLPLFGSLGIDVEFDYEDPVPRNREGDARELLAKAQAALWLINSGYEPHAVLEVVGLPDMEAGELVEEGDLPPHWVPHQTEEITKTSGPGSADKQKIANAYADMLDRLTTTLKNGHQPIELDPFRSPVGAR